jgi:hypothetical protein
MKKAARDTEVEVITCNPEGENGSYLVELVGHNPFDLISIGRIMGMDEAITKLIETFKEY